MKNFEINELGGVSFDDDVREVPVRLNAEETRSLFDVLQRHYDMEAVRGRIPDWVAEQIEGDNFFFADFNSHLFSDDEISVEDIQQRLLGDEHLIVNVAAEYRSFRDEGARPAAAMDESLACFVSMRGVLGEILCDKHHKELEVGRWMVRVVEKGDTFGLYGKLTHDKDEPLVEFYDRESGGEFTGARYRLQSLLTTDWAGLSIDDRAKNGIGLSLYLDVPEWTVGPGDLNVIGAWLHAVQLRNLERNSIDNEIDDIISGAKAAAKAECGNEVSLPWEGKSR